jgi:uncharacterized repeat protein (TIGR02543 family)/uncharacterized repeat protein (TIGR01451 family)
MATFCAGTSADFIAAINSVNSSADQNNLICISADFTLAAKVTLSGGKHVHIASCGDSGRGGVCASCDGAVHTILRGVTGVLFTVNNSGTQLELSNIVIDGNKANSAYATNAQGALVAVDGGGSAQSAPNLIVGPGAALQNNKSTTGNAAGVTVGNGGFLRLDSGGVISGNAGGSNGGVYVTGATSKMVIDGGAVTNNTGTSVGGIYLVTGAQLLMSSGTVSYNSGVNGGGVYLSTNASFTMDDGTVEYNTTSGSSALHGGGIDVAAAGAKFTMNGGYIQYNSSPYGGGMSLHANVAATAQINAGNFIGNQATGSGAVGAGILFYNGSTDVRCKVYIGVDPAGNPTGQVNFINNQAPQGTAGAIGATKSSGTLPTAQELLTYYWPNLFVGPNVTFNANQSSQGRDISANKCNVSTCGGDVNASAEQLCTQFRALAAQQIQTSSATPPFSYAYNDFDIQMPVGCTVAAIIVTFHKPDGSVDYTYAVPEGGAVPNPNPGTLSCGDYGTVWYTDAAHTNAYDFSKPVYSSFDLYPLTTQVKTVTFQVNGGNPQPPTQYFANDDNGARAAQPAPDPTKTGYTFGGWYQDPGLTVPWNFGDPVPTAAQGCLTLYAKWIPLGVEHNVYFCAYPPVSNAPADQLVPEGYHAARPYPNPQKAGYTFLNWYLCDNSNGCAGVPAPQPTDVAYDFNSPVTGDVYLCAKYEQITHTVTFYPLGGSPAPASQTVADQGTATQPPTAPAKYGSAFVCWATTPETDAPCYDFSQPVTSDVALYAKYNAITYTVKFESNGGSAVAPQTVGFGDTVIEPKDPTRDGYAFCGWFTDPALAQPWDFSAAVTGDMTLYACWTQQAAAADVRMVKTASVSVAGSETTVVYTLTAQNLGPANAEGVLAEDTPPPELQNAEYSLDGGNTWNSPWPGNLALGLLPAGETRTVLLRGSLGANPPRSISNTAVVTSTSPADPNMANNTSTVVVDPDAKADVSVSKTAVNSPVNAGEQAVFLITVKNNSPDTDAQNVAVWEDYGSLTQPQYSVDGVNWQSWQGSFVLPVLQHGASRTLFFRGTVPADAEEGGLIANGVSVTSATADPDMSNNAASASAEIAVSADLSLKKTQDHNFTVQAGEYLTYTLTVSNAGPSDAHNAVIEDYSGFPYGQLANPQYSYDGGNTWSAWPGSVGIETIPAGQTRTVMVRGLVKSAAAGVITNAASVSADTNDPNLTNNASGLVSVAVDVQADLTVRKTPSVSGQIPNPTVSYFIDVANNGPSDAPDVTLTDLLPAHLGPAEYSLDNGVTWQAWSGSTALGGLVSGGAKRVLIRAQVSDASAVMVSNTASVSSTAPDPDSANNSASATVQVSQAADVGLAKTAVSNPVDAGTYAVFRLAANNSGPETAQGVTVWDDLSFLQSPEYSTNGGVTWQPWPGSRALGSIAPGAAVEFLVRGLAPDGVPNGTNYLNSASVSTATVDTDSTNNTADAVITIVSQADLSVTKTANLNPVQAGQSLIYAVTVANAGPSSALGAVMNDTVSGALDNVQYSTDGGASWQGWSGSAALGDLGPGAQQLILIRGTVRSDSIGSIVNTASASSSTADPNPTNNSATVITNVDEKADVRLVKTVSVSGAAPNQTVTYRLEVQNLGPSDARNIELTDNLPAARPGSPGAATRTSGRLSAADRKPSCFARRWNIPTTAIFPTQPRRPAWIPPIPMPRTTSAPPTRK